MQTRTRKEKHMPNSNHYDVIIIGTGAGGGTLAYKPAPSGNWYTT
jgi:choline dehydrogenase-like flavoprotein